MRKFSDDEQKIIQKIYEDGGNVSIPTIIYARKSTLDKSENSIETQINLCTVFINTFPTYFDYVGTFQDEEKSGMFTENRDGLLKAVELLENNRIKILVCTKWDRFSRDPLDLRVYSELFMRNGGIILAVDDPIDFSAIGQLKYDIMAAFNKYYVHRIAEDTKAVLINKTSKGQSGGGVANYGYQFDEDNFLVQNPVESVVVADIFDKFELGYSYSDIIEDLKVRNIKTRKENDFTQTTIHDMLQNVKYKGVYRYNRKDRKQSQIVKKQFDEVWVEGGVKDPIISAEQFDEVQKILELRKGVGTHSEYMLSGVMICEHCGTKMHGSSQSTGKGKPRKKYYICPKHEKKAGQTCVNKGIAADIIEEQIKKDVTATINNFIQSKAFNIDYFKSSLESKKKLKSSLQKSINNLQAAIDDAAVLIVDPDTKPTKINALERMIEGHTSRIKDLKNKMNLADRAIASYEALLKKKSADPIDTSALFSNEITAKQLVRVVVNKVVVGNQDIKIEILEK